MSDVEKRELRKWIKQWEKTGSALKKAKIKELRAPDYYEKNKYILNEMLKYAFEHRKVSLNSGLVEQQRLFKKMREKEKEDDSKRER